MEALSTMSGHTARRHRDMQVVYDIYTSGIDLALPRVTLARRIVRASADGPGVAQTGYGRSHAKTFRMSSPKELKMVGCCGIASSAYRTAFPRLQVPGHT
jgi:hypothetical protein